MNYMQKFNYFKSLKYRCYLNSIQFYVNDNLDLLI